MAEGGDIDPAAPGLDEQLAAALGPDDVLAALLTTAADTLGGPALLFARPTTTEPFVAVARALPTPSAPEVPPALAVEPPALLDRLRAPGAALLVPSRKDPIGSLDRASLALLEAEGAGSMLLAALGEHGDVDGAVAVVDAGRPRPFARADSDVLAALALTLAPAASRVRHALLHRAEQRRRQTAEARITGTVRLVELLGSELGGAVITYRADGRCSLVTGPAARRLLRSADAIGRPLADVLVPEPTLLAALERARAGEPSTVALQLGGAWLDVRFIAQLLDDGTVVGGVLVATDTTSATQAVDALRESAGEAEAESEQRGQALDRVVAAGNEREETLTNAIHDDVLQTLSALSWRLDALAGKLEGEVASEAAGLAGQVRQASQRLGSALDDVAPPAAPLDDVGSALVVLVEGTDFGLGAQHRVVDELTAGAPPGVAEVLLAIAAEAVANAATHARPSNVEVTARQEDGGIALIVRDDGRGFDPAALGVRVRGRGVALMRERARLAGGWLRLESRPGRGTTVHAWLPLA